jgi:twitching motility two-component system response regulator PilH
MVSLGKSNSSLYTEGNNMAKSILIVEDSPTELTLIKQALQTKSYSLSYATDGEEAIAKATKDLPDLILLDVVLPKKNGFQVCRQLKTTAQTKNIKIILLTSKNQESDKFWGMKQGADEYLTKPFKNDDLLKAIGKFV